MDIGKIVSLLELRLSERRTYRIPPDGFITTLEQEYEDLQESGFSKRRIKPVYDAKTRILTYADMCIDGPGKQAELGKQWGIPLPLDYLEFCSFFSEYIFSGKTPIQLWGAENIKETTLANRDGWNISNTEPIRLFYFAKILGQTADFAFRWNEDYTKMDIVYSWDYGDVGEPLLLGSDGDRFVSDIDFTSWLARMLDTDAYPIFPGDKIPTADGWIEQNAIGLIRIT